MIVDQLDVNCIVKYIRPALQICTVQLWRSAEIAWCLNEFKIQFLWLSYFEISKTSFSKPLRFIIQAPGCRKSIRQQSFISVRLVKPCLVTLATATTGIGLSTEGTFRLEWNNSSCSTSKLTWHSRNMPTSVFLSETARANSLQSFEMYICRKKLESETFIQCCAEICAT